MGAVLQQLVKNAWQPLALFSRKLNPAQQKYSAYDRELLAIYEDVKSHPHPGHHSRHSGTTGWISRFSCPQTITPDPGRQFESQLFHSLAKLCGIQPSRTAQHPAANGLVERFHRTLKAAIMCHADQHWTEALPMVLLGIRTAFKEDLQASLAELVYGEPLRIPGEPPTPTAEPVDPAHLIAQLRQYMARLRPNPATRHASPVTFVHSALKKCTHVFLRQDTTRRALEPLPGPITEGENNANPRARQARHRVNR
ncbi:uncharacterized protein LOC111867700 [Cryptotermes secundus]|uniref:uncharacterized protein LOC111867700 n=1 Tax=Cryptotermes secundus TaxID=105785 RepID=UPI000CD7DA9D|nr:uncharacterized protein LOC111867700 [Cryptotermes secundus]